MYSTLRPRYLRPAATAPARCAYGRRARRSRGYLPAIGR